MILRGIFFAALHSFFLLSPLVAQSRPSPAGEGRTKPGLVLTDGWSLASSCKVDKPGEVISTPSFRPIGWYTVTVPTTVVAALLKLGVYPDPDYGMNLRSLPGMSYPIGANFSNTPMQQDSPFMVPWWYRKEFVLPESY
jgi:exo-1,4-beta-D-glucosaminidase